MLDSLRNAAKSFFVKVLMAVLVLSFALWGINDVFRGFTQGALIEAGETKVSEQAFTLALDRELQALSQRTGQPFTRDQARLFGFDRALLNRFVTEAVLDEAARRMGLGRTDAGVVRDVLEEAKLDPAELRERLQMNGLSEEQFIASERQAGLRQQIADGLVAEAAAPDVLIEALHRYSAETRRVSYLLFGPQALGETPEPDQAAIETYFKENKASFRAPEYRKFSVLRLDVASLARTIEVTDEDLRRTYEAQKNRYATPEQRAVDQIIFETEDQARAAAERIRAGAATFDAVAAERGLKPEEVSLGTMAKEGFVDPAVAEAAFSLGKDAVSDPVKSRFGPVLVRVREITPGAVRTFEEVKDELKASIASERAGREMAEVYDRVDDERAGGTPLADIAARFKLEVRRFEAIDRQGRGPDGKPVEGAPDASVLESAFETDVGLDSNAVTLGRDGYAWVDVEGVTPARERTLDEVREEAVRGWKEQETRTRLNDLAAAIVKEIAGGKTMEAVAAERGLEVKQAGPFRRSETPDPFSSSAVATVFATPQDKVGQALAQDGTSRIVFRVGETAVPPLGPEGRTPLATQAEDALSQDLLGQYVTWLQTDIGVQINQAALARVLGGGQS